MRAFILLLLLLPLVAGCTPRRQSPHIFWEQTAPQAFEAARLHAEALGGVQYLVAPTGSMEPFITGGDRVVVVPIRYDDLQQGMLANYKARWLPAGPTVIHWTAARSGEEWIMDGQANRHYEKGEQRMGRTEFRGVVIAVYTQRPAPR